MISFFIIFTTFIIVLDQAIKYNIVQFLKPIGKIVVLPDFLDLIYVENQGAALGILKNQRWLFILSSVLLILFFFYMVFYKKTFNKLFLISAALIVGGGISNMIDRIFLGYVIDYIQLSFFSPVCNLADYCITIGAILCAVYLLRNNFIEENTSA